ncbi:MAG TPA: DUF2092 domain-containing protein [Polyangia bacterium]|jgi:hypothetical protein
MKRLLLILGLVGGSALAVEPPREIDPAADAALQRMSDYLASLRSFRVESRAVDERVTTDGQKLQFLADTRLTVARPNRLRAERLGAFGDTIIRYDGSQFSIYGKRTGYYTSTPAPRTLDAAVDFVRARYGVDAPGSDLIDSDVHDLLMANTDSVRDLGLEPIDGTLCRHLAARGRDVDWQLWIEDGARPLPRRYVVITKDQPQKPEFAVTLSHWEPNAPVDAAMFTFVPPPGAERIRWMPLGPERAAR